MSSPSYFKNFPKVSYDGRLVTDITARVRVLEQLKDDPYAFLPYTVVDDMRPEDVSHYYYGDESYVWLVYLANGIIDPATQWPLSTSELEATIRRKYADRTEGDPLEWSMDELQLDNVVYCELIEDREVRVNYLTYLSDPSIVTSEWRVVRVYDYETERNDDLRTIWLVNKNYAAQAQRDLKKVLNG